MWHEDVKITFLIVENVAKGRPAYQSGLYHQGEYIGGYANKSVDGKINSQRDGLSCSYAYNPVGGPAWWQVDLGREYDVVEIKIYAPATDTDKGKMLYSVQN